MKDLKAKPTGCEEADESSSMFYIPCDEPATRMVKTRDPKPYRMCDRHRDHNVRNREAADLGPFEPEHAMALVKAAKRSKADDS